MNHLVSPRIPCTALLIAMVFAVTGCATVGESTDPRRTVEVVIVKRADGWKVEPGVQGLDANTRVQFRVDGDAMADVYMLDRGLFDKRRLRVPKGQQPFLIVNPRAHHGIYPYYVVVKDAQNNYFVAEGNSMPVFIME